MRTGQAVPRTRSVVHRPVHGQRIWAISGQVELRPCWEDGWYQTKGSLVMFADNRRVARPGKNWRRSVGDIADAESMYVISRRKWDMAGTGRRR